MMHAPIVDEPVFVVFEGLDGTGKSTCARDLAEKMGAELITTSSPEIAKQIKLLKADGSYFEEIAHSLYLEKIVEASTFATELLASGRSVVADRYLLSTTVYAEARGSQLKQKYEPSHFLAADLTVYLSLASPLRAQRLHARKSLTSEDNESLKNSFEEALLRGYHKLKSHRIVGDWFPLESTLSIAQITNSVMKRIEKLKGKEKICEGEFS